MVGGCFASVDESFSSLLAISASDHIRGLLLIFGLVLPPGVCLISDGGR